MDKEETIIYYKQSQSPSQDDTSMNFDITLNPPVNKLDNKTDFVQEQYSKLIASSNIFRDLKVVPQNKGEQRWWWKRHIPTAIWSVRLSAAHIFDKRSSER